MDAQIFIYVKYMHVLASFCLRLSDQSLRCLNKEALGPWLPSERPAKILIRLGGCPG